jgi:conserved oligomeric Golgi complex subunit 4
MSTYFFRRSVEKAFELDEMPADINQKNEPTDDTSPPLISSAVDDVMYIVNKLLHRTLHTSRYDVVSSVVSTITRVLTGDFIGMIQRKMRDEYYPKASNGLSPLDEKTVHFLVLINNLDIASTYTQRIVDRITSGTSEVSMVASDEYPATPLPDLFPFLADSDKVSNLLQTLSSSFTTKATELQTDALNTLFNQIIKPKLRPLLADCFSGIDYSQSREPTPDNVSDSESESLLPQDKVRVKFERGWKALMGPLRAVLTQTPFTKLLNIVCAALAQIIERRLWAYLNTQATGPGAKRPGGSIGGGVSALGAIKLERDVAAIVNTVAVMGGWKIREVFKKCTEICLVLGEDDEDYQAEVDDDESVLTQEEREKVRRGLLGEQ